MFSFFGANIGKSIDGAQQVMEIFWKAVFDVILTENNHNHSPITNSSHHLRGIRLLVADTVFHHNFYINSSRWHVVVNVVIK